MFWDHVAGSFRDHPEAAEYRLEKKKTASATLKSE